MEKKRLFLPGEDYIYFTDRMNLREVYCVDHRTFSKNQEARFMGHEDFISAETDEMMPKVYRLDIVKSETRIDHYDIVDGPMTFPLARIKTLAVWSKHSPDGKSPIRD